MGTGIAEVSVGTGDTLTGELLLGFLCSLLFFWRHSRFLLDFFIAFLFSAHGIFLLIGLPVKNGFSGTSISSKED